MFKVGDKVRFVKSDCNFGQECGYCDDYVGLISVITEVNDDCVYVADAGYSIPMTYLELIDDGPLPLPG